MQLNHHSHSAVPLTTYRLFFLFVAFHFSATPGISQHSLLTLCTGMTPQGTAHSVGNRIRVECAQGKLPTHCTLALAHDLCFIRKKLAHGTLPMSHGVDSQTQTFDSITPCYQEILLPVLLLLIQVT